MPLNSKLPLNSDMSLNYMDSNLSKYPSPNQNTIAKRGLFDLGGSILQGIFGLATDKDLQVINNNLHKISTAITNQNKFINSNFEIIKSIAYSLDKVTQAVNTFLTKINNQTITLHHLTKASLTHVEIDIIHFELNNIQTYISNFIQAIIQAGNGKVTHHLFPTHNLKQIINYAVNQYSLKPLYTTDHLLLYYPFLEITLLPDSIMIHIPFIKQQHYTLYTLLPFPSPRNNSLVTTILPNQSILLSKDHSTISPISHQILENKCLHSPTHQFSICSAYLFLFQQSSMFPCEMSLIKNNSITKHCNFTPAKNLPYHHKRINHYNYFYFPTKISVLILCPNNKPNLQTAFQLYALPDFCSISTTYFKTLPTKHHKGIFNITHPYFLKLIPLNISNETKLTFSSEQKYTMNLIKNELFSYHSMINESLKPIQDYGSFNLNPYVLHGPLPVVAFICMIIFFAIILALVKIAKRIHIMESTILKSKENELCI